MLENETEKNKLGTFSAKTLLILRYAVRKEYSDSEFYTIRKNNGKNIVPIML